jgi:hypothetical protein
MRELRRVAMATLDPRESAGSSKCTFGMAVIGETDSSLAEGVGLSDRVINRRPGHGDLPR